MIKQIKIPAVWSDGIGSYRQDTAIFDLGPGPCGKTVESLEIETNDTFVLINQNCEDGEAKQFIYRVADLIGRIEVTYV